MEHARYHEQAIEVGGRRSASLQHALVVVHAHHWIERRIGPAEIADDFPAPRLEPRQIRIGRIERAARPLDLVEIRIDVERQPVVAGIRPPECQVLEKSLAEQRFNGPRSRWRDQPGQPAARRAAVRRGRGNLSAHRPARHQICAVPFHAAIDRVERVDLCSGEAPRRVRIVRALRQVGWFERAAPRVVDQSVAQAVGRVAFLVHRIGDHLQLPGSDRRGRERPLIVDIANHRPREVEHRRADDDAVEIVGKALGGDEALAAAG